MRKYKTSDPWWYIINAMGHREKPFSFGEFRKTQYKIKLKLRLIVKWNEKISHTVCNGGDNLRKREIHQAE